MSKSRSQTISQTIVQAKKHFFSKHAKTLLICVLAGVFFLYGGIWLVPLKLDSIPVSTRILDAQGKEIGEVLPRNSYRHLLADSKDIPQKLKDMVLALEDKRFFSHKGIDIRGLGRAFVNNIEAGRVVEGASTIESQLLRNIWWLDKPRSFWRKCLELYGARALAMRVSKESILTHYLNTVSLGHMTYGYRSGARRYFAKELAFLNDNELIALISIAKNPSRYDPKNHPDAFFKRYSSLCTFFGVQAQSLTRNQDHSQKYPYLLDWVQQKNIGPQTTIDLAMTERINDLAQASIKKLARKSVSDYGVVVVHRPSMQLKVMLGGASYQQGTGGQVNSVFARNQPGSTIKPFTYLLAFKNLGYTPETLLVDAPVQYETAQGYAYNPKNFSLTYAGQVSTAEALSQSLNVPAIKVLEQVGVQYLLDFLHQLGVKSLDKNADFYGLALTLGVGDMSLWELTRAYSIFAHRGSWCDIVVDPTQTKTCTPLIEPKYIDMITSILSNRFIKLPSFPVDSTLDFADRWVVLKSGTSRHFADNWTIGFTDEYLIGVWFGNKDGSVMKGVSGANGAGDLFQKIVYLLDSKEQIIQAPSTQKKTEDYLEITSPLPNSHYQIDPSIPTNYQTIQLRMQTNMQEKSCEWRVDGAVVHDVFWKLVQGRHSVNLRCESQGKQITKDVLFWVE